MTAPRTKRQFAGAASDPAQRRITSFFSSSGTAGFSSISDESAPRTFASSDASVQANLLSVGMRIRKAVPEGYKSGSYSAFPLWEDKNNKNAVPTGPTHDAGGSRVSASVLKELLPFCGINKIGGLDTQSFSAPADFAFGLPVTRNPLDLLDHDLMADVPGLTLSQESVESNGFMNSDATSARTRKRFFVDEEESEVPDRLGVMGWQDVEVSPQSLAPVDLGNGRRMAMPRKGGVRGKVVAGRTGQENRMAVDNDFEEAAFLDPTVEVDMDDF